ncbi:MAG: type II toxin-antitoxin system HicA family toxin [Candidatus Gracilibacteria bacterium]|jgi:predicted RNA binding protein YcfA (HicA-like mRNA interferase family)
MPKLPSLSVRNVIAFLKNRGFILDHTTGSHFIFYHTESQRRAVVPRHNKDMPKGTLLSILRESGFTRNDLMSFLE